jgi:hypothetical protein
MGAYIDANLDPTEKKPFRKLLPEFIAKFPRYTEELTTHDTPPEFLRTKYRHYLKMKKNAQKEQNSTQASAQATTPAIAAPASTPAITAPAPAITAPAPAPALQTLFASSQTRRTLPRTRLWINKHRLKFLSRARQKPRKTRRSVSQVYNKHVMKLRSYDLRQRLPC